MSRIERAVRRRRRRVGLRVVAVVVVLVAAGFVALRAGTREGEELARAGADRAIDATVLGYLGERPALAVLAVGAERSTVLVVPGNLVVSVPGHGTGAIEGAVAAGPQVMQTTVANLLGVPVRHRGILSASGLDAIARAAGGIEVDLGTAAKVGGRQVGPGPVRLGGREVAAYLDGPADPLERTLRFQEVVTALLRAAGDGSALQQAAEGADPGFGAAVAAAGAEAELVEVPVRDAGSGVASLDAERAEAMVKEAFGAPGGTLADVVLLNGNGVPGIGAEVAREIVPAGFRVVVSTNARTFDVAETQIVVGDDELVSLGERLRGMLGVGAVSVGKERTGLADITVVIGKDFAER